MAIQTTKGWSTHMPTLIKILNLIGRQDVLEMGAGYFSTPLLHWICKYKKIKVLTLESDPDFYEFARTFQSPLHRIKFVTNWDEVPVDKHWGLVFIDHGQDSRRGQDALRFKDNADYIVLHDTERGHRFGYHEIWQHFKYRYDWLDGRPWTSVVSNFKDLTNLSN